MFQWDSIGGNSTKRASVVTPLHKIACLFFFLRKLALELWPRDKFQQLCSEMKEGRACCNGDWILNWKTQRHPGVEEKHQVSKAGCTRRCSWKNRASWIYTHPWSFQDTSQGPSASWRFKLCWFLNQIPQEFGGFELRLQHLWGAWCDQSSLPGKLCESRPEEKKKKNKNDKKNFDFPYCSNRLRFCCC